MLRNRSFSIASVSAGSPATASSSSGSARQSGAAKTNPDPGSRHQQAASDRQSVAYQGAKLRLKPLDEHSPLLLPVLARHSGFVQCRTKQPAQAFLFGTRGVAARQRCQKVRGILRRIQQIAPEPTGLVRHREGASPFGQDAKHPDDQSRKRPGSPNRAPKHAAILQQTETGCKCSGQANVSQELTRALISKDHALMMFAARSRVRHFRPETAIRRWQPPSGKLTF